MPILGFFSGLLEPSEVIDFNKPYRQVRTADMSIESLLHAVYGEDWPEMVEICLLLGGVCLVLARLLV